MACSIPPHGDGDDDDMFTSERHNLTLGQHGHGPLACASTRAHAHANILRHTLLYMACSIAPHGDDDDDMFTPKRHVATPGQRGYNCMRAYAFTRAHTHASTSGDSRSPSRFLVSALCFFFVIVVGWFSPFMLLRRSSSRVATWHARYRLVALACNMSGDSHSTSRFLVSALCFLFVVVVGRFSPCVLLRRSSSSCCGMACSIPPNGSCMHHEWRLA